MGWDALGNFNVFTKEDNTDMEKPRTIKCVGNDSSNDISIVSSPNMEGREGLGIESCLILIRNGESNVLHRPQITYSGDANWGITRSDLIQEYSYIF